MKHALTLLAFSLLAPIASAQEAPLWMRHSALSPDGQTIAFSYKGDIYTVPATGGKALQLTTNDAYDSYPIWSPDGQRLAFASDRMGSLDIYMVGKEGGEPLRLTTHSFNEYPIAFSDNTHVLFANTLMPEAQSILFPSSQFPQVYQVSVTGGRPTLYSSIPMEDISVNKDGKRLLFHDKKGYEDPWRKHHTSSITRDIWLYDTRVTPARFTKLTDTPVEDRNAVWAPDGQSFYYLSETGGTFNIYKRSLTDNRTTQLTHFKNYPVRFLSAGHDGTLCFGFDGEIYTLREGEQPHKVPIQIVSDSKEPNLIRQLKNNGATEIALSPNGKEIAFILRGDVFVTSTEFATTKQITDTPEQERSIDFAPDGRRIVYASEREGVWQIYQTSLTDKKEPFFVYAQNLKEERLTHSKVTSFQPQYSPDGKEIAFLENRTTLRILNLANKQVRTVMDGKYEYSYQDGDQSFEWSPDSRWLLTNFIGIGGWNNKDIALVSASGNGEIHDLTDSGYSDASPKWVLDGKAILWESDRAGYRSHGSWGAETDWYLMFLDLDAYQKFLMSKEELALTEELEKANKPITSTTSKDGQKKKRKQTAKVDSTHVKPLSFDLVNAKDRIVRLTGNSSNLGDAWLNKKGDKLYYLTVFENNYDLWVLDIKEREAKIVMKNVGNGRLEADKEGKNLYLSTHGGIKKLDLDKGTSKTIAFNTVFNYRPQGERAYIFDHIWQQVKDKFYDPKLHGVNWDEYRIGYRKHLAHINNNYDFQELLSEMLGELNGSHTGARYRNQGATLATAALGLFFDNSYTGDGLRITEIIAKSPLTLFKNRVKAGCIIEKIDGQPILAATDYFPLLDGKAGKRVELSIYDPSDKSRYTVIIKAISKDAENNLLYKRWVERNKQMVEKWSGGKIAYVHVRGMDSPSFRTVYSELLSNTNRQKAAVVVDTRHNGGGWLHDDLATLLSGKAYQRFMPRGQYIGSDPFNKWLKPSVVLMCEDNYSNAHGFPWVYRELQIGKLIGAPVPGTMTAVWWEIQIDPSIVFGVPQVGCMDMRGQYMENQQLDPDILVYNSPEQMLNGEDAQLKAAVDELMKNIKP